MHSVDLKKQNSINLAKREISRIESENPEVLMNLAARNEIIKLISRIAMLNYEMYEILLGVKDCVSLGQSEQIGILEIENVLAKARGEHV